MFAGRHSPVPSPAPMGDVPRTRRRGVNRLEIAVGLVVLLGIALAVAWPHVKSLFVHEDVTATVVSCSGSPSGVAPTLVDFAVLVEFRNTTGSPRTVIPEDDQGHPLSQAGSTQNAQFTLAPHDTFRNTYYMQGDTTEGCGDLHVKAAPVK